MLLVTIILNTKVMEINGNNVINNLVTQGEWKIQLIMAIKFTSSKDSKETRTMYTKSDNIETMTGGKIDENIEERFESLLQRHQKDLEESKKRSKFIFDGVDLLYHKCNKRSLNSGGSYVDFPKCFQYAVTVALNHEQIKIHPERTSNITLFIDQYHWKKINFPPEKKDF